MSGIFIVEDRGSLRRLMERALAQEGYEVSSAATVRDGVEQLQKGNFDLVLTDLKLPDGLGLEVVAASREHQADVPVVVLTAFGTVQTAVEAMKLGAVDFLEKPLEIDELLALVGSLVGAGAPHGNETRQGPGDPAAGAPAAATPSSTAFFQPPGAPAIVGRHPRLMAALRLLRKVAPTESTVLLTGESGTGKELFARALHALSRRSDGPFVAVNCAAIPETLIENELFGHEKGAFTGAARRQPGRFELARGGTIFLDEIGELKLEVQSKVLRVLEERTFERIGGGRPQQADVRVVAATNRDLEAMASSGAFRQDLFYRLDVFPIALPALRDRPTDVPRLAEHLIAEIGQRLALPPRTLTQGASDLLQSQSWPGNVRQLANLLERCLILSEGERIHRRHIAPHLPSTSPAGERQRIREALAETQGDKRLAAAKLDVSYRTLQRKIREYDLEGFPQYRS